MVYSQSKDIMLYEAFPVSPSNFNFSGKTLKGHILNDGVYYYILEIKSPLNMEVYLDLDFPDLGLFNPTNKVVTKTGYLHVLR